MINIAHTKQLAVIGHPISHSFSPQIHNFIAKKTGRNFIYTALDVLPDDFENVINGIRTPDFAGVNITTPYKIKALELMDVLSDKAKRYASVNTCVNKNGKLYGYTTDADGFYRSLAVEGVDVEDKDILFIGAGGVTKPLTLMLCEKCAKSISIHNRTISKAEEIALYVKDVTGFNVNVGIDKDHYDLVINTTTVGMYPNVMESPLEDMSFIDERSVAIDIIYNPLKTRFLEMAEEKGAKILNGLGMLIFQAMIAFELFADTKLPDIMYKDILKDVFEIEK